MTFLLVIGGDDAQTQIDNQMHRRKALSVAGVARAARESGPAAGGIDSVTLATPAVVADAATLCAGPDVVNPGHGLS